MAWDKAAWVALLGTCTTLTDLSTNTTMCADHDVDGDPEIIVTAVRVAVDYSAAPNADCQLDVYARDTDNCNLPDTLAMFSATIPPPTTTGEGIATYQVNVAALDHIRVCVTNPDLTNTPDIGVWVKDAWG